MLVVNHVFAWVTPAIVVIFVVFGESKPPRSKALVFEGRLQIRPVLRFSPKPLFLGGDKCAVCRKHGFQILPLATPHAQDDKHLSASSVTKAESTKKTDCYMDVIEIISTLALDCCYVIPILCKQVGQSLPKSCQGKVYRTTRGIEN